MTSVRTLSASVHDPRRRISPPALAVFLAATLGALLGALLPLARPGAVATGIGVLAVLPLAALAWAGVARAATITAALAYVAALAWAYASEVAPTFSYDGLTDAGPQPTAVLLVATVAALPAAWLPLAPRRPSTVVLWVLYLLGYVPTVVVPLFMRGDLAAVLPFDLALLASMGIASLIVRRPPAPIAMRPLSLNAFTGLLVGLGLLCSAYIAVTFGVSLSLPGLASVYDTRADFRAAVGGSAAVAGYIVPWAGNVINPLLMALGVARRRAEIVTLGIVGQLLIYSVTGFKSILFSVALVPLVYLAISVASRVFGLLAAVVAPVIIACCLIATSTWGSIWPLAITARLFATPGQVGFYYYEYFSDHPSYALSQSILSWVVSRPYGEDVPFVIGSAYFSEGTNANGNIWADAFANFGFAGIVCFTLVLGLVLWIADGLAQGRDARVAGPMFAIAGLSLANSALFTTVLTLGLALGCLLIALMPPAPGHAARPSRVTR